MPKSLHEALLEFQANAPRITKDAKAGGGNRTYRYATLPQLMEKVLPELYKVGLAWTTKPIIGPDGKPALEYELVWVPRPADFEPLKEGEVSPLRGGGFGGYGP